MRKFLCVAGTILLLVIAAAGIARIYQVNHAEWLEKYGSNVVVYKVGAEAEFASEMYYMTGYEALSGYYMQIMGTELIETDELLSRYNMTLSDLEALSTFGSEADFSDYTHVYIVTAQFGNRDYATNADYHIEFDNFLLVGPDFCISPSTDGVNAIPDFNPELAGASGFGISSERVLTFKIPFLIDTVSETAISVDYLIQSCPKLLIGYYPDEIYLELPAPTLKE